MQCIILFLNKKIKTQYFEDFAFMNQRHIYFESRQNALFVKVVAHGFIDKRFSAIRFKLCPRKISSSPLYAKVNMSKGE